MTIPAISVAMSVYNGDRFLTEAIESVLAQTFGDFEFLILDDGSRDGTRAIIELYAASDPRIRPIFRENRGLIASLNQLLGEARAPVVARMDADDICTPDRFERQMTFLAANPDYGVIGARSLDIDEHGSPLVAVDGTEHPLCHEDFIAAIETGDTLMCHPAVMYRRDFVVAAGGYHAAFRHCEDYDLWLRLAPVTRLASLERRLIHYRRYPGQVSNRHATEQHIGAAVAFLAYQERNAGRPDPTTALQHLPPIDGLDALFGRKGISRDVRARVACGLVYSREGLGGEGFDLLVHHLRDGGERQGMWRTVGRLIRFGKPAHAAKLAATLATC